MAPDGLDDLDQEAEGRRQRRAAPSRRSRPPKSDEERRQERERLDEERRERERREREANESKPEPVPEPTPVPAGKKRDRPPSIPFYPDPENEEFLWTVAEAATARREKIPATAVLRLAMRRLSQQMTPSEIVRELSGPVQTGGKMGRPRR
ncbi:hypothetical protein [Streptomyces jumonjinensis]|uniref:Uncharacterized protein n=1 Tax=Streptomyces jumonjinensis TaxID=1945 RepID=A0A646KL16_STRJU|nr:hypothetical protein [Streptomyces jumonjinensis]MQT02905.1 hypothetical protein [Streptomyces jumonjinensis]